MSSWMINFLASEFETILQPRQSCPMAFAVMVLSSGYGFIQESQIAVLILATYELAET